MSCECYKLIRSETAEILSELVHKEICNGMIPIGGVAVTSFPAVFDGEQEWMTVWAQAVCSPSTLMNVKILDWIEQRLSRPTPAKIRRRK